MNENDKQLLLKDLSCRLTYGVKMIHIADDEQEQVTLIAIARDMITLASGYGYSSVNVEDYRPCLFPLTSMTDEQKEIYNNFYVDTLRGLLTPMDAVKMIDWLNKNHFDYRGLIEKGLAFDATKLNI